MGKPAIRLRPFAREEWESPPPVEQVCRKVVYRMYPSPSQETALLDMLGMHQRLYNAALEQRILAWQRQRKSVGFAQQCRDLTELRDEFAEYGALPCHSSQVTLKRLHLAYQAFFSRVKSGEEPGFLQQHDRQLRSPRRLRIGQSANNLPGEKAGL